LLLVPRLDSLKANSSISKSQNHGLNGFKDDTDLMHFPTQTLPIQLKTGLYFARMQTEKGSMTEKVVVME